VTRQAEAARRPQSRWQRTLGGALAAILLLPVPVFALTWVSNWTGSTNNVNPINPTADPLAFTPTNLGQDMSILLTRDFLPANGNPSVSANVQIAATGLTLMGGLSGTETLTLRIWTSGPTPDNDVIATQTIKANSNQFISINDQSGTGAPLQSGLTTPYTVHVQFSLAGTGTGAWSMSPSSTHTIVANISDGSP
jgi:hypothetical protein